MYKMICIIYVKVCIIIVIKYLVKIIFKEYLQKQNKIQDCNMSHSMYIGGSDKSVNQCCTIQIVVLVAAICDVRGNERQMPKAQGFQKKCKLIFKIK